MSKIEKKDSIEAPKEEKTIDLSSFKDELEALKQELEKLRKEKKSLSDAEIRAIEEAREDMITDDQIGCLSIDEKYKEEGYHYRIIDSSRIGRVARMIKLGYEVVYEDMKIGDKTVTNTGSLTGAVTVNLSERQLQTGVLMRCPKDRYDKRQQQKAKQIRELDAAMMQDSLSKSDFGSIEIGSDLYKK